MEENINKISVTNILEKVIEIAELNNDNGLKKWAHLELEGYFVSNKYLTDDVVVPNYREVPGEHRDNHNIPLQISDPRLIFINTIRLRESVPELESLYEGKKDMLIRKDPELIKTIKDMLGVSVSHFIINPSTFASVLNSIKQEAIDRSKKYISRGELMSLKLTHANTEFKVPNNISFGWLWKNIPLSWWGLSLTLLIGAFSFGVYISGIPQVKEILRHIPGYNVDIVLPTQSALLIEKQVTKLIEAHNSRISDLQKQFLEEEKLGVTYVSHQDAAKRIKETIREENKNFQNELRFLKELYK